jgi:ABC-type antimicrobial peptide transport system ATPase subunit
MMLRDLIWAGEQLHPLSHRLPGAWALLEHWPFMCRLGSRVCVP